MYTIELSAAVLHRSVFTDSEHCRVQQAGGELQQRS
jgi:hypothetical protein